MCWGEGIKFQVDHNFNCVLEAACVSTPREEELNILRAIFPMSGARRVRRGGLLHVANFIIPEGETLNFE